MLLRALLALPGGITATGRGRLSWRRLRNGIHIWSLVDYPAPQISKFLIERFSQRLPSTSAPWLTSFKKRNLLNGNLADGIRVAGGKAAPDICLTPKLAP
jgi:hypothetical protein